MRIETRPAELRRASDQLWERYQRREALQADEFEALAEVSFRLAVLPDTDPADAFALLYRAHRLDRANPKHAYHLGRLHLVHGDLDKGAKWLRTALELCPTSHRIWSHLSLVQRALDEAGRGQPKQVTGELRKRAGAIAAAVRAGQDDIPLDLADVGGSEADPSRPVRPDRPDRPDRPAAATVPRITNPGTCRWSGIADIEIDAQYRGETSQRKRDEILPALDSTFRLAGERPGGAAAFAILAVEWLVCGYPPGPVRTMADSLPAADEDVAELLDRACAVFEADERDAPRLLAEGLEAGQFPPMLVALMHQRRLLWRPLAFPNLNAYRAARRLVAGRPDGAGASRASARAVADLLAALQRATENLRAASVAPMAEPGPAAAPAAPAAPATLPDLPALPALQAQADDLRRQVDDAWQRLSEITARASSPAPADAAASAQIATLVAQADAATTSALATLARLRDANEVTDPAAFEQLEAAYKDLKPRVNKFRRKLRYLPGTAGPAAQADAGPEPGTAATDADQLAAALDRAEQALAANLAEAWQSFEPYHPARLRRGPLLALRTLVAGREAEARYRMGEAARAQRIWHRMLAEDRLNTAVLKNLAVAHTCAGELAQATQAWQSYLEALYFLDIAAGSPRPRAEERARVHAALAAAYGARPLRGGPPKEGEDVGDLAGFLGSRAAVAAMSGHHRLAAMNAWLGLRSPTLVLGVSRSTDEDALSAARDHRLDTISELGALLPDRIRAAFCDLCASHVAAAHQDSLDVQRRMLSREPYYEKEEEACLEGIKATIFLKLRAKMAIHQHSDWAVSGSSGDVIANLAGIDAISLNPDEDLVRRAAGSLGIEVPGQFWDQLTDLEDSACLVALSRIGIDAAGGGDAFPARFRSVAASWARNKLPADFLDRLDDPQHVYWPSVALAFKAMRESEGGLTGQARSLVDGAITAARQWVDRLPGATGPARALAQLLEAVGRVGEARDVLAEARAHGLSPSGRLDCAELLAAVLVQLGEAEPALNLARDLIGQRPGSRNLLIILNNAYVGWLNRSGDKGGPGPRASAIAADFDRWLDGAGQGDAGQGDANGQLRREAVSSKRALVVQATVAASRGASGAASWRDLVPALRAIRKDDPGNEDAVNHEFLALFNTFQSVDSALSSATGEGRRRLGDERRAVLDELKATAPIALAVSSDSRLKEAAQSLLDALNAQG